MKDQVKATAAPTLLTEFVAPGPLLAVGLLAINDHWLKARLHNALTGKLSDLAICFFLPSYLAGLAGLLWRGHARVRLVGGAVVTALVFTALEMSDAAGALFLRAMAFVAAPLGIGPMVLTRDATDLLALLVIPAAVAYERRRQASRPAG